ncbi:conserved hypothetical protein [Dinoroseobacter shibae DFL 12 = DSM 16493]|uniref:Aspartyl-trna synthetase n=1 Tax=Dinoroseobacter shibae (strain DSM 16493 / NCIMB 14021 / DFL 12) TaxID=398580 RepID=A8LKC1_DINSH|nr:SH3 domain-containing protein [Dinoroseobacter shibae]ABV94704.1 conserved hypothetical protein [Dinoroseobacter shibae DFL 12 = DSM 16493]URF46126.1 SH3 domain-containing protein [Dinoroseobacter shibae]URF50433.1 SH3 domain-containing protein [Dinoroseobacter shibae]
MIHRAPAGCLRVLCVTLVLLSGSLAVAGPARAADPAARTAAEAEPRTGPVTNLPLPRFVSMKAAEGNVRRGPSLTHRIDWVFKHRNMPLEITGEYGHWRRVRDRDGAGGWMHYSLLSGARTVIIEEDLAPVLSQPNEDAQVRARAELGVIARLEGCENAWCRVRVGRTRGWMQEAQLWGVTHTPPPVALPEGEAEAYSGLAMTR